MKSKTALIAKRIHLQQWVQEIKDCNSRPKGMTVDAWCQEHGLNRHTYYWHLKEVRAAYINAAEEKHLIPSEDSKPCFVEVPQRHEKISQTKVVIAIGAASLEISDEISDEFLIRIFKAVSNVK